MPARRGSRRLRVSLAMTCMPSPVSARPRRAARTPGTRSWCRPRGLAASGGCAGTWRPARRPAGPWGPARWRGVRDWPAARPSRNTARPSRPRLGWPGQEDPRAPGSTGSGSTGTATTAGRPGTRRSGAYRLCAASASGRHSPRARRARPAPVLQAVLPEQARGSPRYPAAHAGLRPAPTRLNVQHVDRSLGLRVGQDPGLPRKDSRACRYSVP